VHVWNDLERFAIIASRCLCVGAYVCTLLCSPSQSIAHKCRNKNVQRARFIGAINCMLHSVDRSLHAPSRSRNLFVIIVDSLAPLALLQTSVIDASNAVVGTSMSLLHCQPQNVMRLHCLLLVLHPTLINSIIVVVNWIVGVSLFTFEMVRLSVKLQCECACLATQCIDGSKLTIAMI
jgi:hypothetical protein